MIFSRVKKQSGNMVELGAIVAFGIGQEGSRNRSRNRFSRMFLVEGPCKIEEMFQVLNGFP